MATDASCIFCKIIAGKIPSMKIYETEKTFAFMDIAPISQYHSLVIPKYHAAKLHEMPDEYLSELLPIAKKIAKAMGVEHYNLLQNNGREAHQAVDHVHVHVIPKPSQEQGLVIGWPTTNPSKEELTKLCNDLKEKL